MIELTARQEEIYNWMLDFFLTNHRVPTYREIGRQHGGIHPNAVAEHIRKLAIKGYLRIEDDGKNKSNIRFNRVRFTPVMVPSVHA
jgi:SOS-response transcriptional repressor LexA